MSQCGQNWLFRKYVIFLYMFFRIKRKASFRRNFGMKYFMVQYHWEEGDR
jgi:hypothetical protein